MAKVNEFQRRQLASSVVGVAPADRSGQIIGSSISKLGTSVAQREAVIADQQATVQANLSLMQFGLGLQRVNTQLQREMAANPDGYANKLLHDGEQLVNTTANSIADPRVRSKFLNAAGTLLRSGVLNAGIWTTAKKKENAVIAANESMRLGTIQTGQTITLDGYLQNAAIVEDLLINQIPDDVLSTTEITAFFEKNGAGMLESHLANRVNTDPQALIDEIDEGKYNEVPHFTAKIKNTYLNLAQTRLNRIEKLIKESRTDNYQELAGEFIKRSLTFDMISSFETAQTEEAGMEPRHINQLREGLIKSIAADAKIIASNEPAAKKYIDLTYKIFDDRIERSEMLEGIVDIFRDGVIDNEEAQLWINTKANLRELKTSKLSSGWEKAARTISDKALSLYDKAAVSTKEAINLRNLSGAVLLGVAPAVAALNILNNMNKEKVIEDNPGLASFEDPVMEANKIKARNMLQDQGYKTDNKRIEILTEALEAKDGQPK